jgi:hypothetical protein
MKVIFSFLFAAMCCVSSDAQTLVQFCPAVHENNCVFGNTKFIAQKDSLRSMMYIYIQNDNGFGSSKLVYRVFEKNSDGSDKLIQTFEQFVQQDWVKAWTPYYFPSPAKYKVEISNEANEAMGSNTFELISF